MSNSRSRKSLVAIAAAIAATGLIMGPAAADPPPGDPSDIQDNHWDKSDVMGPGPQAQALVTDLLNDHPEVLAVWDQHEAVVQLLTPRGTPVDAEIRSVVDQSGLTEEVVVQGSPYALDELTAMAAEVAIDGLPGVSVTWAAANASASGIDIGVEDIGTSRMGTELSGPGGVPVTIVEVAPAPLPASRDYQASPFIAGADMHRWVTDTTVSRCSTSFAFVRYLGPGNLQESLFTADHCGVNGAAWDSGWPIYSNAAEVGIFQSVYTASSSSDLAYLTGEDYAPYMYAGTNTSNTAVAIKGGAAPILNVNVCYSGAPSGTVCANTITHVGLTVTYSGMGYSYQNMVRTEQASGVSAVGNGDSGGPVVGIGTDLNSYAMGVISGMSNAGDDCQGDPATATRQCSDIAFFAPINQYFASNPLDGLQVVP